MSWSPKPPSPPDDAPPVWPIFILPVIIVLTAILFRACG